MPLSETNKVQSKSIEDLIAQLDKAPVSCLNSNIDGQETENCKGLRPVLKGKRVSSNSVCEASSMNSTPFQKHNSFGVNSEPILANNIISSKKYTKHSRQAYRGTAKKSGGGGKHTWGKAGCEIQADDVLDPNDPNYDSEDTDNVVMVCVENNVGGEGKKAANKDGYGSSLKEIEVKDLETEIRPIILEYFQNGDTIEVIDHLKCYSFFSIKAQLIAYCISIALDHNNTCKELISRLLRDMTLELFDEDDFNLAFDNLLQNLGDLKLDNPNAPETIGTFVARGIADKVINRTYIDRRLSAGNTEVDAGSDMVRKAIESARVLITINDHLYQLSHVWGNKGGFLAVRELTDKIHELIQEYYDSGDMEEAIRCLKELNVPHFHHEFVFEALDFTLQKGDHAIELISNLLKRLCVSVIITYDQLKIGFARIYGILPDICLDVPNASGLLDKVLNQCSLKGIINDDIIDLAPNRSRKRFVSEGDGGRIKENGL